MPDGSRVFQSSDLAGVRRREFIDEARAGEARLRDTDGAALLMVPERRYRVLAELRDWTLAYLALEGALARPRAYRRPEDLGVLAWAAVFDDQDLGEFRREFASALSHAVASQRTAVVERIVEEWARTARALEDDEVRAALTSDFTLDDYVEVGPPEDSGRDLPAAEGEDPSG